MALSIPIWAALFFFGFVSSFEQMSKIGIGMTVLLGLLGFGLFVLVQGKSLKATGQTIGKKVVKTRIATMAGGKPEFPDLLLKRYLLLSLIGLIPFLGKLVSLINVLMIFKSDRRCLHDLMAGTQVVKVQPGEAIG